MNKEQFIRAIKACALLALIFATIIAIVLTLGASVAWVTGWTLAKSALAVVIVSLISVGTQAAVKDL